MAESEKIRAKQENEAQKDKGRKKIFKKNKNSKRLETFRDKQRQRIKPKNGRQKERKRGRK